MSWALSFVDPRPGKALAANEVPTSTDTLPLEGFTESFSAVWDADRATRRSYSWDRTLRPRLEGALTALATATGDESLGPMAREEDTLPIGMLLQHSRLENRLQENEARILELKGTHPELRTLAEVRDDAAADVRELENRASRAHGIGALLGGLVAAGTDPINLITAPFVAQRGTWWLAKMGLAASGNATVQAALEPEVYSLRKELGLPQTVGDSLVEVGNAAAAGVVLEGGLLLGHAALRRGGPMVARTYRAVADRTPGLRSPRGDAAVDAIEGLADALSTHPAADVPVGADAHRAALQRSTEAVLEDRVPDLLPDPDAAVVGDELNRAPNGAKAPDLFEGQRGLSLEEIYARAPESQTELVERLRANAERDGAEVVDNGLKPRDSAVAKLGRHDRPPGQLSDVPRARYLVSSPEQADRLSADLAGQSVIEDRGWLRKPSGFFDRKIKVRTSNGIVAEVQVSTPELHEAERLAHPLYERQRALIHDEVLADADAELYYELERQQGRIYREAIDRGDQRMRDLYESTPQSANDLRKASRVSSSALWSRSAGEYGRHGASGDDLRKPAMPPPEETTTLAGRPSKSKNRTADFMDSSIPQRVEGRQDVVSPAAVGDAYGRAVQEGRLAPNAAAEAAAQRIMDRPTGDVPAAGEVVAQRPVPEASERVAARAEGILQADPERKIAGDVFDAKGNPVMRDAKRALEEVGAEEAGIQTVLDCVLGKGNGT